MNFKSEKKPHNSRSETSGFEDIDDELFDHLLDNDAIGDSDKKKVEGNNQQNNNEATLFTTEGDHFASIGEKDDDSASKLKK